MGGYVSPPRVGVTTNVSGSEKGRVVILHKFPPWNPFVNYTIVVVIQAILIVTLSLPVKAGAVKRYGL
jgi:hypothetical protein